MHATTCGCRGFSFFSFSILSPWAGHHPVLILGLGHFYPARFLFTPSIFVGSSPFLLFSLSLSFSILLTYTLSYVFHVIRLHSEKVYTKHTSALAFALLCFVFRFSFPFSQVYFFFFFLTRDTLSKRDGKRHLYTYSLLMSGNIQNAFSSNLITNKMGIQYKKHSIFDNTAKGNGY